MKSRELVSKGISHLIGDGSSVDIWHDPWIPKPPTFKPMNLVGERGRASVAPLIDSRTKWWDAGRIREKFDPGYSEECPAAIQVWALSDLPWGVINSWRDGASAVDWISSVSAALEPAAFSRFMTVTWFLWWKRNTRIHEGADESAKEIIDGAIIFHNMYNIFC
ncbi:hypothetical protein M569_02122 [Genlisea aurea]|uniref:Reverse transcriptase zinc-binding domain-containing protein n=1 Tax=Genlisea aurea TaxID=192259 RepID=S8CZZ8_9LAMI|nr:hypothetical protein M569_02122 [Genlisea aurea]